METANFYSGRYEANTTPEGERIKQRISKIEWETPLEKEVFDLVFDCMRPDLKDSFVIGEKGLYIKTRTEALTDPVITKRVKEIVGSIGIVASPKLIGMKEDDVTNEEYRKHVLNIPMPLRVFTFLRDEYEEIEGEQINVCWTGKGNLVHAFLTIAEEMGFIKSATLVNELDKLFYKVHYGDEPAFYLADF